jgi:hypothetical protein
VSGVSAPTSSKSSNSNNISGERARTPVTQVVMSNYSRPMPAHLRGQSMGASQQSSFLQQKIADKKTELANLKDLQALSGGLADQMQMLADKLQTLSDGTEGALSQQALPKCHGHLVMHRSMLTLIHIAVAAVLSNWHNVLRAINMASSKFFSREH